MGLSERSWPEFFDASRFPSAQDQFAWFIVFKESILINGVTKLRSPMYLSSPRNKCKITRRPCNHDVAEQGGAKQSLRTVSEFFSTQELKVEVEATLPLPPVMPAVCHCVGVGIVT